MKKYLNSILIICFLTFGISESNSLSGDSINLKSKQTNLRQLTKRIIPCNDDDMISLLENLDDAAFTASSLLSYQYMPEAAKLNSTAFWLPLKNDLNPYLQVELRNITIIQKIIIESDNFTISRSIDGNIFNTSVNTPFEAKFVRFQPHNTATALKFDLLVCKRNDDIKMQSYKPACYENIGIDEGKLKIDQIILSSNNDNRSSVEVIKLSSTHYWTPLHNDSNKHVLFNFMKNRFIRGLIIKGGNYGWVESFKVLYAKENCLFSTILDQNNLPKEFIANIDSESYVKIFFPFGINARYLKIQPISWHEEIEMKIELIGCDLLNSLKVKKCAPFSCPVGFRVKKRENQPCPRRCEPIIEDEDTCSISSQTINTFDSRELKYDACNHALAKDISIGEWNIKINSNCSTVDGSCKKMIEINDNKIHYNLILYPSLTINLNGYYFTSIKNTEYRAKMSFVVSKIGESLLYRSYMHGITVSLNQHGETKIGLMQKHLNKVEGLCGYYNNRSDDDLRMKNGSMTESVDDFGKSWLLTKDDCILNKCTKKFNDIINEACEMITNNSFKRCEDVINSVSYKKSCYDMACDYLMTQKNITNITEELKNQLKCYIFEDYVTKCLEADEKIQLEEWREIHSCIKSCPPPMIHFDCYRRNCEPSCGSLLTTECVKIPKTCFTGCFCPEGTIRKGETCVPLSECRDCICDGYGKSQFITYDRKRFAFEGNCTYLLTRDVITKNIHTFEIYVTLSDFSIKALRISDNNNNHKLIVQKSKSESIEVIVDEIKLSLNGSYSENWLKIAKIGNLIKILLVKSQVELDVMINAMSFSIKLLSSKYENSLEGLCGNCKGDIDDDLTPNSIESVHNYTQSWLADDALESCQSKIIEKSRRTTTQSPKIKDQCLKLNDAKIFGKCHQIVDQTTFIQSCRQDLNHGSSICESIAAYVRECSRQEICVEWRSNDFCPMKCSAPFVYSSYDQTETCESENQSIISTADNKGEGCFCPNGKVLYDNKCLDLSECPRCENGRLKGNEWQLENCTKCKCSDDLKIECEKIQCPQIECRDGSKFVESRKKRGECCAKYKCVATISSGMDCNEEIIPNCRSDQRLKSINYDNGCSGHICECIPESHCELMDKYSNQLQPGFILTVNKSDCCPKYELVCDKSTCPLNPTECDDIFQRMKLIKNADDDESICCDVYECREYAPKFIVYLLIFLIFLFMSILLSCVFTIWHRSNNHAFIETILMQQIDSSQREVDDVRTVDDESDDESDGDSCSVKKM